jgi:SAC3/GANP family
MNETGYVVGTCEDMCPASEVAMRTRNKLVHFYEHSVMLKEFSRSAADKKSMKAEDLRTFKALQRTLDHLFNK